MAEIDRMLPGWEHMASFEDGRTLWHVNETRAALLELDEYRAMSPQQRAAQEWIVLLHDVAQARSPARLSFRRAGGAHPARARIPRHGGSSASRRGRPLPRSLCT